MDETNVNRKHKDSVFSKLFGNQNALRELYSAIEGITIPDDAIININTLSDVLYMQQINDLSFTINDRIVVLIEHQSTISYNVPIRLFMYLGRIYEKILERKELYQKKLLKIPAPELIVLYNGVEPFSDHKELRLSAAFKNNDGFTEKKGLPLELIVKVYNINQGKNPQMLAKSKILNNYSIFIGKINEYKKNISLEKSVKAAVKYCIENDILRIFLEEHATEVLNMLTDDITIDELADIRYKEGREDGMEEGREVVQKEIAINLLANGSTVDFVHKITGLDIKTIEKLVQ